MSFSDVIKKSVMEGFSSMNMSTTKVVLTLLIAYGVAMYIHLVYKVATKKSFYVKSYGISMTLMAVVTTGIILAMQTNLVISLGMVGALSIVRFRTAIKDPMDLLFLFWSIATGIICGAGLYELVIILAVIMSIGIVIFQKIPLRNNVCLLVVNANTDKIEDNIYQIIENHCKSYKTRTKNVNHNGMSTIIQVTFKDKNSKIISELMKLEEIISVELLEDTAINA